MSQSRLPYLCIQYMQLGNCEVSTSHTKKKKKKGEKRIKNSLSTSVFKLGSWHDNSKQVVKSGTD